jgi:hypothetical protein
LQIKKIIRNIAKPFLKFTINSCGHTTNKNNGGNTNIRRPSCFQCPENTEGFCVKYIMGIYKTPVITEDIEKSNCEMKLFINWDGLIALKTSMNGDFDDEYGNAVICINKQTANDLIKELKILIKQMPNG